MGSKIIISCFLQIEYDAFGVPISSSGYGGLGAASSADIDEAVRSILS